MKPHRVGKGCFEEPVVSGGHGLQHRSQTEPSLFIQRTQVSPKTPVKGSVYFAVAIADLGELLFGYDTGVISGAILFITRQFSLSSTLEEIVISAVLGGAVAGAPLGGALTDQFGRRSLILNSRVRGA